MMNDALNSKSTSLQPRAVQTSAKLSTQSPAVNSALTLRTDSYRHYGLAYVGVRNLGHDSLDSTNFAHAQRKIESKLTLDAL